LCTRYDPPPQIKASKKLAFGGESQMMNLGPSEVVVLGNSCLNLWWELKKLFNKKFVR